MRTLPIDGGWVLHADVPDEPERRQSLVRRFLRDALGKDAGRVRLTRASTGQPVAEGMHDMSVSWAHRLGFLLIAAGKGRVGVDLEIADRVFAEEEVVAAFFSREDQRALQTLAPEDRLHGFYLLWTLQEAYLKALGEGLDAPLGAQLDFSWALAGGRVPRRLEADILGPRLGRTRVLSRLIIAQGRRLRVAKIAGA